MRKNRRERNYVDYSFFRSLSVGRRPSVTVRRQERCLQTSESSTGSFDKTVISSSQNGTDSLSCFEAITATHRFNGFAPGHPGKHRRRSPERPSTKPSAENVRWKSLFVCIYGRVNERSRPGKKSLTDPVAASGSRHLESASDDLYRDKGGLHPWRPPAASVASFAVRRRQSSFSPKQIAS